MKQPLTLIGTLFFLFALILTGCNSGEEVENTPDEPEQPNVVEKTDDTEEEEIEEVIEEEVAPEADLGDYEVEMTAKAKVDGDFIRVLGESNLVPGSRIRVHLESITRTGLHVPISDNTTVDDQGNFEARINPLDSKEFRLIVSFRADQRDEVLAHYGEGNAKIEGPLVYREENNEGEIQQIAKLEKVIQLKEDVSEFSFDIPERIERPEDYGENNVWIEAEITNDHRYMYVHGRSNLLEGTGLFAEYWYSENDHLPQNNSFKPLTNINPDGTFEIMVRYTSLGKEGFVHLFTHSPNSKVPTEMTEAYGENYEKMEGDIVVERTDGSKRISTRVYLDPPEIEVSDDILLTTDDGETMMSVLDDMLFDFDESKLKDDAKEVLADIVKVLETLEDGTSIEIRGHTDSQGSEDYNLTLSEERAQSVMDFISENGSIDHLEFELIGYGQAKPVASNNNEDGRKRNRRVEIVINPNE
ncbi:OmpA family protein [Alkalihalobacterium bogoriense]|uniref:OmpA family protein n=1 Tax=Alkalihalobacterium bogoriense TaxID=246272 RepID=UPI000687DE05|nr:OmpA family protein [Alkalihalobacterium bogoriense]